MSAADTVAAAAALQQDARNAVAAARARLETALLDNCRLRRDVNKQIMDQIKAGQILAKPEQVEALSILHDTIAEISLVHRQLIQQAGLQTCRRDGCHLAPEPDGYCAAHQDREDLSILDKVYEDDDREYCHDPDCPNEQNFPYGRPDEHAVLECRCQICEETGTQPTNIVERHTHGVYEKLRRDGFRLTRCVTEGCTNRSFVPKQVLREAKGAWQCAQCLWTRVPAVA